MKRNIKQAETLSYSQKYYLKNRDRIKNKSKKYYSENRDEVLSKASRDPEKSREYYLKNKEKYREANKRYVKRKRESDPQFRVIENLRNRMYAAVKNQYGSKAYKSMELLGASIEVVREHLEKQFSKGMSWDNYGEWHIDHIVPCSSFNLKDPEQQKECFHYTNLQPLWALDNILKSGSCSLLYV